MPLLLLISSLNGSCFDNCNIFLQQGKGKWFIPPIFNLLHNYRSLPSILDFYNTQFYDSTLIPMVDSKSSHDAKILKHFSTIFENNKLSSINGIYFIDVNGHNEDRKHSWVNMVEADVVCIFICILYWNAHCNCIDISFWWQFDFSLERLSVSHVQWYCYFFSVTWPWQCLSHFFLSIELYNH